MLLEEFGNLLRMFLVRPHGETNVAASGVFSSVVLPSDLISSISFEFDFFLGVATGAKASIGSDRSFVA